MNKEIRGGAQAQPASPRPTRQRLYTGDIGHAGWLLKSAAGWLHMERCEIGRRMRNEDQAAPIVASHLPEIKRQLAKAQECVADLESVLNEEGDKCAA